MADIKKNFVDKNIVYIHGEFDESIIELLPKINDIVIAQKLLKAGKYLRAILQFTKDNIPQTHCYCENLIKK